MRIVAFNIAHDSSVCSVKDGKIEFFCKEERITRVKRDMHPFKSLETLASLNLGEIDHILYHIPRNNYPDFETCYSHLVKKYFDKKLENYSNLNHHLCHASLAFYNSGFSECLTFVVDRNGSLYFRNGVPEASESESIYFCSYPDNIIPLYKSFTTENISLNNQEQLRKRIQEYYPNVDINLHNSIGIVKVYEAATTLIDQHPLENGKTMGLSSYGSTKEEVNLFINGNPIINYFSIVNTNHMKNVSCFKNLDSLINKNITENNYKFYADKSKLVQIETQKEVLRLIKKYTDKTGIKNVCIVGGYGLNVVANNFYIENLPDVNFYFEPVSDDTGISIGAALLKYRQITKNTKILPVKNTFYHYYNFDEKLNADGKNCSIDNLIEIIELQKSLAIFDGIPESGPRALGHRSILFDPRNKNAKSIINKIKKREWYRPFAGIILEEMLDEYFISNNISSYPNMTVSLKCKNKTFNYVPGIIHVDNTCRIQTVSEGFIFDLLKNFYEKTGCPMLLNTSFNLAGEPLVQTKKDAIDVLYNSDLDYVYFAQEKTIVGK